MTAFIGKKTGFGIEGVMPTFWEPNCNFAMNMF